MGDCASRFSGSETKSRELKHSSKNNKFFYSLVLPLDSPSKLYLLKKQAEFQKKLNLSSAPAKASYLYLLEIQKVKNLRQPGAFYDHQSPFVSVSLEPNGPYQETLSSDQLNPHWFRLVQFKSLTLFREIKVVLKGNQGHIFGNLSISTDSYLNQRCVDEWFKLENGDTKIKLRIQIVFDEKKLFKELLDEASNELNKL